MSHLKTADRQEGADKTRKVLASAHREARKGRPIPRAAAAGPEPGGVDAVRGRGLDRGALGQASHFGSELLLTGQGRPLFGAAFLCGTPQKGKRC